jgi:hypothetical protein
MRGLRSASGLLVCSLLLASPAFADPTAADRAAAGSDVQKGTAAMTAKRFRAAAELFESAFKRVPEPKTLFSAATAWQKNGDSARAANAYARYLKEAPEKAPAREKAKKELDALSAKLGQLAIKAEGASQVSVDNEPLELPLAPIVYVNTGAHELEAKFGDKTVTQPTTATAGAVANVLLVVPPEPKVAPPVVAAPAPVAKPPPEERRKPLPPLVVYIGAGAAVLVGGLTVISALDVSSQKDTFDAQRTQENLDAGRDKQLRTNILLAVTGGIVVFTGVAAILLVDWKGRSGENVKVGAGPGAVFLRSNF